MKQTIVQPLSGKPSTRQGADKEGKPVFRIAIRELTPLRARIADAITSAIIGFSILTLVLWVFLAHKGPVDELIAGIVTMAAHAFALSCACRVALRRTTRIVMKTATISVRRWYGWEHFDRNLEHRFVLLNHDKARHEQLRHDLAVREAAAKGRVIQKKAYYAESFHVVLAYAGHRRDLAAVYGPTEAMAVIARLQYCDRVLNEAMRMGGGVGQRPQDEWQSAPGDLPNLQEGRS